MKTENTGTILYDESMLGKTIVCNQCHKEKVYGGPGEEPEWNLWIKTENVEIPNLEYIRTRFRQFTPLFRDGWYCSIKCLHLQLGQIVEE